MCVCMIIIRIIRDLREKYYCLIFDPNKHKQVTFFRVLSLKHKEHREIQTEVKEFEEKIKMDDDDDEL